jgi:glycosyltransferase involved in cell wall biosynthesis
MVRERLRVLLLTEGTYPYHFGGVSTWCEVLLRELPQVDFTLMSMTSDPRLEPLYKMPPNVVELCPIPLWGLLDAAEAHPRLRLAGLDRRRRRTTEEVVRRAFVPILQSFLEELLVADDEPERLAASIHQIHRFALEHDLDAALRSRPAWNCFVAVATEYFPHQAAHHGYPLAKLRLADLTSGMQWLHHLLFPIAGPLPKVDVAHAAMSGVCTLVAVCEKLEHGAGFLLTEHGIYVREAYLAESATSDSLFLKILRLRFALRITEVTYALADLISPCCEYNKRWELRLGAHPDRLKTIYYGVDPTTFSPRESSGDRSINTRPTVVWMGRINPLKDLRTLLQAAYVVQHECPDIQFLLYGSAAAEDEGYYQDILTLRSELGLEDVVSFAGYIGEPAAAYNQADLVVLSSVSEAFPFSILEAMLCAKPVVATAVGGVPEEIAGCGIAVEPRNPVAFAQAILQLINDPERRAVLGHAAREKAVHEYSLDQFVRAYETTYEGLSRHASTEWST